MQAKTSFQLCFVGIHAGNSKILQAALNVDDTDEHLYCNQEQFQIVI